MTDIGNCRPSPAAIAPGGAPITGPGSTSILMSAAATNGVVGQSSSAAFIQPNMNGISPNYSSIASSVAAGMSPSSSGPSTNATGAAADQQRKQQTAFIVLPVSFRMAAGVNSGVPQPQIQQNASVANSVVHVGSVLSPSAATAGLTKTIGQQQTFTQPGSAESFPHKQPLSSDQAVKTAVSWIVQDAKQRQHQQQPIPQQQQQIYHRNNGKLLGPPAVSPAAVAIKRATEGNSRKFSTSSTMQNEVS